jgi:hypothetical protein
MTNDAHCSNSGFPTDGKDWTEDHWHSLLAGLIAEKIVSWREVTSTVLGSINPSQVGTSIASKKTFQKHFEDRKCWAAVRSWHFSQNGRCVDCGTRIDLQADHAIPKEFVGAVGLAIKADHADLDTADSLEVIKDIEGRLKALLQANNYGGIEATLIGLVATDLYGALAAGVSDQSELANVADRLDNMVLRCRRHNVIRRPSHANGGVTFLTAEAALMWLLFVHRPDDYRDFANLCRAYGLTMANIRFEEAWAMARWLESTGAYQIKSTSQYAPDPKP